ncbi:hypothetical protein PF010_g28337 [Phytophthora fragariae]|nr:hypothetical protein PF010_g28337 [Phytophthora fragariae]
MVLHTTALVLYAVLRPSSSLGVDSSTATIGMTENPVVVSIEVSPKVGAEKATVSMDSPEYHIMSTPMTPLWR